MAGLNRDLGKLKRDFGLLNKALGHGAFFERIFVSNNGR